MVKTMIIYGEDHDPTRRDVTHVAIGTDTDPPYVYCIYKHRCFAEGSSLGPDIVTIPIKSARALFDFKLGKLESAESDPIPAHQNP